MKKISEFGLGIWEWGIRKASIENRKKPRRRDDFFTAEEQSLLR